MTADLDLVPGSGSCRVSRAVLDGASPVARAVREEPAGGADNGWRILGVEDSSAASVPEGLVEATFNAVCAREPALIGVYDFRTGTDVTIDRTGSRIRILETSTRREIPEENFYVPPAFRADAGGPVGPGADERGRAGAEAGRGATGAAGAGGRSGGRGGRRPARAGEACILSRNVLEGRGRIRFAVRQRPANDADNGWRVFSEFDSDEFVADPSNMAVVAWETVCGYEPAMRPIRDLPVGADVEIRHQDGGPNRVWGINEGRYLDEA